MQKHRSKGISRFRSAAIALIFTAGLILAPAVAIMATATSVSASVTLTDDYPTSINGCRAVNGSPTGSFTCNLKGSAMDKYYDPWGEENRECTSFVAWRLGNRNGFTMPFHADAGNWKSKAQALKYAVDSKPVVGAVAWSSTHVAWVAAVSADRSQVTLEEYDENDSNGDGVYGNDGTYDHRVVAATAYQYIHFKDTTVAGGSGSSNFQPFAADFNNDGIGDIGIRNVSNGNLFIKHGPSFGDQILYPWAAGINYQPIVGDFNGDSIGDIGLYNTTNGVFYIKHGPSFNDQITYPWAAGTNFEAFAGDFNGDGLTDIGLRNVSNGNLFIKHGPSFSDQVVYTWAPGTNYEPFSGDFNGDGKADIGLRNVSNGNFFIKHGPSFTDQVVYTWAVGSNFQPFAADFNNDGIGDIGIRNVSNGNLFIKHGPSFGDQVIYTWAAG